MSQEKKYLIQILKHDNWHHQAEEICLYDPSCVICHPAHPLSLTKDFIDFWNIWIVSRC
jgi:hypothetical protein